MQHWGYCNDEWTDNGNFPFQLYVREARRMVSDFVFTEKDRVNSTAKNDSIGLGSYNMDIHMTQRLIYDGKVMNEGWLPRNYPHEIFEMPYRMIVPRQTEAQNLLVPVACSASHVAFGAIRLEATWSVLGEAAGRAAVKAWRDHVAVQSINVSELQHELQQANVLVFSRNVPAEPPKDICPNYRWP